MENNNTTSPENKDKIEEIKEESILTDEEFKEVYDSIDEDPEKNVFKTMLKRKVSEKEAYKQIKEKNELTEEEFEKLSNEIDEKNTDKFIKKLKDKASSYHKTKEIKKNYPVDEEIYEFFFEDTKGEKTKEYTTNFNKKLEESLKIYTEFKKLEEDKNPTGEYSKNIMNKYEINPEGYMEIVENTKKPNKYYDLEYLENIENKIKNYKHIWDLKDNNPEFKTYNLEKNQYQEVYAETLEDYYDKIFADNQNTGEFEKLLNKNCFIESIKPVYSNKYIEVKKEYEIDESEYEKCFNKIKEEFIENENYKPNLFTEKLNKNLDEGLNKYREFENMENPSRDVLKILETKTPIYQKYYGDLKEKYYSKLLDESIKVSNIKNTLYYNCFKMSLKNVYKEYYADLDEKYHIPEEEFEKVFNRQSEEYKDKRKFNIPEFRKDLDKNIKIEFKKYEDFNKLKEPDDETLERLGVGRKVYTRFYEMLDEKYHKQIKNKSTDIRKLENILYYNCFKHAVKKIRESEFSKINSDYNITEDEFNEIFDNLMTKYKNNRKFNIHDFKDELNEKIEEKLDDYIRFYRLKTADQYILEETGITEKDYNIIFNELLKYYKDKLLAGDISFDEVANTFKIRCFKKTLQDLCHEKAKEVNEKYDIPENDFIRTFNKVEKRQIETEDYNKVHFSEKLYEVVKEKFDISL